MLNTNSGDLSFIIENTIVSLTYRNSHEITSKVSKNCSLLWLNIYYVLNWVSEREWDLTHVDFQSLFSKRKFSASWEKLN